MKILLTGSHGFVGQAFYKKFDSLGKSHDVTCVDLKGVPAQDVRTFFRGNDTQYDLVIHLAAIVGGRVKIEGDPLGVAVDLSIDSELFSWAMRTRPKRIVYYSSSAAYPIRLQTCYHPEKRKLVESDIDLEHVETPDMTYGWSKLTGELLAQHAENEGLRVHVFRPFSGYGETQSLEYPFPSFIQRGLDRAWPFQVWGDGTQTRDFIHIDDVVDATLTAVREDVQGPVNLGTGRPTSFTDLAHMVLDEAGYMAPIQYLSDKPVGVHYRVANAKKMREFYTPKIELEEGVYRALTWLK